MRKTLLCALLIPGALAAQTVKVTGAAFDSLSGRPLPGAFVTLGSKSATADPIGRFAFDSIAPGSYRLTMQHDLLDSLGLTGIATNVTVTPGMAPLWISTPSIKGMWARVCRGAAPPDSGFIFGTVLDASTRTPVRNTPIVATWIDIRSEGLTVKEWRAESATIDDGSFVMCGVPLGNGVVLRAGRDSSTATSLDLILTQASPIRRQDLALADPRASRGIVRGMVSAEGKGVGNARVSIGGAEVRTVATGQFIMREVPAGTRQIEVQGIGLTPVKRIINVSAGDTVSMTFEVEKVVTLDSVIVRGSAVRQNMGQQFARRKQLGIGYIRDSLELRKHDVFTGVFGRMPSVQVTRDPRRGTFITVGISRGCTAAVFIDRHRSSADQLLGMSPSEFAGIEIYKAGDLPADLALLLGYPPTAKPCAVIAWTRDYWR